MDRIRSRAAAALITFGLAGTAACSAEPSLPPSDVGASSDVIPDEGPLGSEQAESLAPDDANDEDTSDIALVTVDVTAPSQPFDRRLLGTNLPAWIGPDRLADPLFIEAAVESGTSLVRMPGGSWSNAYDWSACELRDSERCFFTDSARPTDFIDFLQATGLAGSWTVSINESAQSAAAAVAFFNGDVGDDRQIGVDRYGADWRTVGSWAQLRADGGNPDPIGIDLWEVGNEVYGGKPESGGDECASFGWEDVWTCDGTEYTVGDAEHDGYLAIRSAMRAVDPEISVGAVGVGDPAGWTGWGDEVIAAAGGDLDYYVVHQYGFDSSPDPQDAVDRPAEMWPAIFSDLGDALPVSVPVAVTEYNLVAFEGGDTEQSMTQAMSALFLADSIGQLAVSGATIANQWNLANGTTASGTDYGLISLADGSTFPAYFAMQEWSRVGSELLDATIDGPTDDLRVYATRHEDGRLTLVAVNVGGADMVVEFDVIGGMEGAAVTTGGYSTDDLRSTQMAEIPDVQSTIADGTVQVQIPAWSIMTIEVASDG